jgi:hypothetical protein
MVMECWHWRLTALVLRGSWTDEKEQFTLFSAMVQEAGVTIAQVEGTGGDERDHAGGEQRWASGAGGRR